MKNTVCESKKKGKKMLKKKRQKQQEEDGKKKEKSKVGKKEVEKETDQVKSRQGYFLFSLVEQELILSGCFHFIISLPSASC